MSATPHDALFKETFSVPERAAEELRAVLPPAFVALLNWASIEDVSSSFVDEALGQRHSDLMFRVEASGAGSVWLYLLFEHQSEPDTLMPWRLLGYMTAQWKAALAGAKLPLIVPVVLHHGAGGWTVARAFEDLYDVPPAVLDAIGPHALRFTPVLDDLAQSPTALIHARRMSAAARLVLLALRAARGEDDIDRLADEWLPLIDEVAAAEPDLRALVVLVRYTEIVRGPRDASRLTERVISHLGARGENAMHTITDTIREEGRQEGRAEGRVEVVIKQLALKFGPLDQAALAAIRSADLARLDSFAERILFAESLDAVLAP